MNYEGCCAVKLMLRWFDIMELWDKPNQVLFPGKRRNRKWDWSSTISQTWLRTAIKTLVANNGGDASKYSGHSLRAGGATDLFIARVPYFLIKRMGRWKSDAAMLYYRCDEDLFKAVEGAFDGLAKAVGGGAR